MAKPGSKKEAGDTDAAPAEETRPEMEPPILAGPLPELPDIETPNWIAALKFLLALLLVIVLGFIVWDAYRPSKTLYVVSALTSRFEYVAQPGIQGVAPIEFDEFEFFSFETRDGVAVPTEWDRCFSGEFKPLAGTSLVFKVTSEKVIVEAFARGLDPSTPGQPLGTVTSVSDEGKPMTRTLVDSASFTARPNCRTQPSVEYGSPEELPQGTMSQFFVEGFGYLGRQLVWDSNEGTWVVEQDRKDTLSGHIISVNRSVFCGSKPDWFEPEQLWPDCTIVTAFQDQLPIPPGGTLVPSNSDVLPGPKRSDLTEDTARSADATSVAADMASGDDEFDPLALPVWRGNVRLKDGLFQVDVSARAEELQVLRPTPGSSSTRAETIQVSIIEKLASEPFIQIIASIVAFVLGVWLSSSEVAGHDRRARLWAVPKYCGAQCARGYRWIRGSGKTPPPSD